MHQPVIPEAISAAAVAILAPYVPGITKSQLERAVFLGPEPVRSEKLLSRREAAAALHISLPTVDRMIAANELLRVKVRGRVFICQSEVNRVIGGNRQGGAK